MHAARPSAAAARGAVCALLALLLPAPALIPPTVPARPDAALVEHGRRLVQRYQCGACHRIPGVMAAQGEQAPSLERFARRSYIAGSLPNDAPTLQRWIVAPAALLPGATMPSLGVNEADARAIAAYLHTLE